MCWDVLDTDTIWNQSSFSSHFLKVLFVELGEAPLLGDMDLLSSWELELCSSEGLYG